MQRVRRHQLRDLQPLMRDAVKIGSRGSKLALWQANWVKSALQSENLSLVIDISIIKTKGDKILDVPLAKVGGKGLFVKEIEEALLNGKIDLAVHSMKDMPADIPEGLCIGSVPKREDPGDALISKNGKSFTELKTGARIGTGSLRRGAQLLHARSDIEIVPLRGNLDTRIRKLETEDLDAVILAVAGIKRLDLEDKITEVLPKRIMLPAVGQGALCIEIRQNDPQIESKVNKLDHRETRVAVMGERAMLNRLEGSCQIPIAGYGEINGGVLTLRGLVSDLTGKKVIRDRIEGDVSNPEEIGVALAERLLSMGADEILDQLKSEAYER